MSNRLCCQDKLEQFFGNQRQKGGTNDNPTVRQFQYNTSALRVARSMALAPVNGNCRRQRKTKIGELEVDNTPLSKRPRKVIKL